MKAASPHTENRFLLLEQQLRIKEDELNSLLQITQAINSNISSHGLLKLYEDILTKQIGVNRIAVFVEIDEWICTNALGITIEEATAFAKNTLSMFKQLTNLEQIRHPLAAQFKVVVPVYHKNCPLAFTFLGEVDSTKDFTLDEKLNFIQTVSNIIAVAIENKRLFRAQVNQKLMKSELQMAGQMQTMLIPDKLPDDERMSFSGYYSPHQEVGGDFYDYIELNDQESIFCIGDISGKGVAAALLMANFQASVRSYSDQQPSLSTLLEYLNSRVNEITRGEKYITLFLAKFNFTTRKFEYVNAGHNPAILLYDGEMKFLDQGCTILGMFEKLPYVNVQSMKLEKEFIAFCYTDGLTDIENDKNQSLKIEDIISILKINHQLAPNEITNQIISFLNAFKGDRLINDDISMLTCKIY
ncbi:MAG: SpoIIE family protein phosphatase [Chitinophagales bacterium]|nr:SpoIIE family protein phosphatase [Chitinophagales bacterium]